MNLDHPTLHKLGIWGEIMTMEKEEDWGSDIFYSLAERHYKLASFLICQ